MAYVSNEHLQQVIEAGRKALADKPVSDVWHKLYNGGFAGGPLTVAEPPKVAPREWGGVTFVDQRAKTERVKDDIDKIVAEAMARIKDQHEKAMAQALLGTYVNPEQVLTPEAFAKMREQAERDHPIRVAPQGFDYLTYNPNAIWGTMPEPDPDPDIMASIRDIARGT